MATNIIDALTLGGNTGIFVLPTGSCSTAAATAAKTATINNYVAETDFQVRIKFAETNTASNPTLAINSGSALPIYYNGAKIPPRFLQANHTYDFIYSSDKWTCVGEVRADNSVDFNVGGTTAQSQIVYDDANRCFTFKFI